MKIIYTGIESSGKSLKLAMDARRILKRNAKFIKMGLPPRPIYTNMLFSQEFLAKAEELGVPIVLWHNLEDIIYKEEGDVFIDEILKYFDARNWADLTLDAKHWLTQGAKRGIHVYGSAQDMSQVEKSFRLLVNEVHVVSKVMGSRRPSKTFPKVKRIWGLCMSRQVSPSSFKGDNDTMETVGWPSFFLIQREDCVIFDTNAKIIPSELMPVKVREREIIYYNIAGDEIKRELKMPYARMR